MYKKIVFIAVVLLLSCASGPIMVHAGPASDSYEITSSVLSGGGGRAASASYDLEAVVGQPTPLAADGMILISESYQLKPGFLYTLDGRAGCGGFDSEPDGDVDGIDLYLLTVSDPSPISVKNIATVFGAEDCLPQPGVEEGAY